MALTFAPAPFAPHPSGCFNFELGAVLQVLFWEPFPKRLRVEIGGQVIVDSRRVMALHEIGRLMQLCTPAEDVRRDLLKEGQRWDGDDGQDPVLVVGQRRLRGRGGCRGLIRGPIG
jgi:hypothetical protein